MIWLLLAVSMAVLVVGLVLRRRAQEQLSELSVAGEVVYADSGADEVLVSPFHGLAGKPDYFARRTTNSFRSSANPAFSLPRVPTRARFFNSLRIACWRRSASESRWRGDSCSSQTDRWMSPSTINCVAGCSIPWWRCGRSN